MTTSRLTRLVYSGFLCRLLRNVNIGVTLSQRVRPGFDIHSLQEKDWDTLGHKKKLLRLVRAALLLACLFGNARPGNGGTTTTTTTTTTAATTTTTTGTTTTAAPTTADPAVTAATFGVTLTLSITKTTFDGQVTVFTTSFVTTINSHCNNNQANARQCCNDMKTYSPSGELYTGNMYVTVHQTIAVGTNVKVTVYVEYWDANPLCAVGTSRRKRAVTGGFVSSAVLVSIMTTNVVAFQTAYSAALTAALGTATTVTVTGIEAGLGGSSVKTASVGLIMLLALVTTLSVCDFNWTQTDVAEEDEKKHGKTEQRLNKGQLKMPAELDRSPQQPRLVYSL